MHDPLAVAHEVVLPIPQRARWKEWRNETLWGFVRARRTNPEDLGKPVYRWWRPKGWTLYFAGRAYGLYTVATIWHREPRGHDSGDICKHHRPADTPTWKVRLNPFLHLHRARDIPDDPAAGRAWISDTAWKWHVWHWHIQIHFTQKLKRWLFERCVECGRGYSWGYAPISHQWDGPGPRWRPHRVNYHHECSSLVSTRQTISQDERLISALFAAYRTVADLGEAEALALLTDPKGRAMEFLDAYRLTHLLGYERDDNYDLVQK